VAFQPMALIVFADIDGVLSALPPDQLAADLSRLHGLAPSVALVLCSGRTRPEIEHLAHALGIRHPFICEHGAAAFVPDGYFPFEIPNAIPIAGYQVVEFGRSSASVVEALRRVADRQGVALRMFSEMRVDEVAYECGMTPLDARLAKLRDYGEMFRVVDGDGQTRARLHEALRGAHLRCVTGTPFDHVGASVDISIGVGMLRTLYRRAHGSAITIGVADWRADGDVLQLVECPVIVEARVGSFPPRSWRRGSNARTVALEGAGNWATTIGGIVREQYPAAVAV
jgi:mannosyl-3-phosphoglycerate phosphatase